NRLGRIKIGKPDPFLGHGILTGCYPNRIGIHLAFGPGNANGLHLEELTMAEMLKNEGYATAIFGKWHLGDHSDFMPNKQGFDEFYGIPYSNDMWPYHPEQGTVFDFPPLPLFENEKIIDTLVDQSMLTTQLTEKSVSFIKKNKATPFFLYVAHPQPHVPLFVSDKFKGKSERGLYGDVIMEIDWSVGQILETIKTLGIDDNTVVIFTSDNGPWLSYGEHAGSAHPLREGKQTAWEGGQREPCIIRYPNKIPANQVINTPLMSIDILPTIAHLTQSRLPEKEIDGKNITEVLTQKTEDSPHEAYYFYYNINELHGVRYKNWKLYYPRTYKSLNGREGGKGGFPAVYDFNEVNEIQLFDLSKDIGESNNVAQLYPEIVQTIDSLANLKRAELGDSLRDLEGQENRPAGVLK
ncbi:MAG: sulfatase, partial [Bacteroidota bacterium]